MIKIAIKNNIKTLIKKETVMAFESRKDKMKQVLQEELPKSSSVDKTNGKRKAGRPAGRLKKPYQFTLKPKNRTKLDTIAQDAGYNSASAFLDDWIEGYEE
ncbi:hypothetical protein SAIN_0828 [Streptococcus anginosus C1051]|jgi:hypothetical protein|nr:hypothetical protein SAIN_0381 [Streptococcus anginosus C1051]AGU81575.1 hypothetical protein SAIN_0828 [Streptococcus anginosus C1051]